MTRSPTYIPLLNAIMSLTLRMLLGWSHEKRGVRRMKGLRESGGKRGEDAYESRLGQNFTGGFTSTSPIRFWLPSQVVWQRKLNAPGRLFIQPAPSHGADKLKWKAELQGQMQDWLTCWPDSCSVKWISRRLQRFLQSNSQVFPETGSYCLTNWSIWWNKKKNLVNVLQMPYKSRVAGIQKWAKKKQTNKKNLQIGVYGIYKKHRKQILLNQQKLYMFHTAIIDLSESHKRHLI